jgi:glucose-6-phosphate isomerase
MSALPWIELKALAAQQGALRQAFAGDPTRAARYSTFACGITLDYSKNLIDSDSWQALLKLAEQSQIKPRLNAMLAGEKVNQTEQRSVGHMLLRKTDVSGLELDSEDVGTDIAAFRL